MPIELAKPIADYFAADRRGSEAVAKCFTQGGVVKDEGHTHKGVSAIKKWKADASAKFGYTSEPFAVEEQETGKPS